MSMSALLSALRGAGRQQISASTIVTRQATGSHVLRIEGYTRVSKMVGNGEIKTSDKITVGGQDWRINCYSNGSCYSWKHRESHIVLLVKHESQTNPMDGEEATIMFQASILDQAGMPSYTRTITEVRPYGKLSPFGWHDFISHKELHHHQEKYLNDGCLTILCDITFAAGQCAKAAPAPDLHGDLVEAIWSKENPDVSIEVGGETFAAHRWMLEARSPVLKEDLALTSDLRVDDVDAEVFKTLLRFIYTDSPPLLDRATAAEKLLVAADRYRLDKLKLVCEEALCRHVGVDSVAATLVLAERHRCPVLREACMRFLSSPENLEAVLASDGFELLKTGCPSALLELVVKKVMRQEQ
jgi:speckle-type POZ protein